ncbi:MAG: hypothetical protein H8E44_43460 [Planctomycetes bacterium]|nr:hypothetical protein [Planctomycetota bacterium]MBL7038628.1 hypothetical protein [Pirellulaceae bacterium]
MANSNQYQKEIEALGVVLGAIGELDEQGQQFVLQTVANRLGAPQPSVSSWIEGGGGPEAPTVPTSTPTRVADPASSDTEVDPKHFVDDKRPTTDVERVICLAYFLAHHRDQRHFKTADVSKLNTEAAQPDLSNTSQSMKQATDKGLLANAKKKARSSFPLTVRNTLTPYRTERP